MAIVHLKNSAGVITEYTGTPPFTINGLAAGTYTFTEGLTERSVTVTASGGGTPAPTPPPTLGALTLSPNTATTGAAYSGTVSGKTASSTLALSGPGAAGLSVSGTAVSGTPTTAGAVDIVETLAGATGSPRTSSGVLTVAAAGGGTPGSTFVSDSFNGAASSLGQRTPETGSGWSSISIVSSTVANVDQGVLFGGTGSQSPGNVWAYQNNTAPANADYDVVGVFKRNTSLANRLYITGRTDATANSCYFVRLNNSTGNWELGKIVAGATSVVLATYASALADGASATARLRMRGSTITMLIDDVQRGNVTDTSITAAGFSGVKSDNQGTTATTGLVMDNFQAINA